MNEQPLPCDRTECVYKAVKDMIERMKEEVAKRQSIEYPEQLTVAKIYEIVASTLAEACRKKFKVLPANCIDTAKHSEVSMDTFILLSRLREDGLITAEYETEIFQTLLKMKPEIKEQVESDRAKGLL